MKLKKKVLPYVMALALALCLTPAAAFAATVTVDPLRPYDTNNSGSIDSGDTDYLANHSFALYQIFTGDNDSGKVLTNIEWGSAIVSGSTYDYGTVSDSSTASNNLIMYLANLTITDSTGAVSKALPGLSSGGSAGNVSASNLSVTTAAELAEYLSDSTVMTDDKIAIVVDGIEDFIAAHTDITAAATIQGTATATSVDAGYYLVVDETAATNGTTNALNKTLLQVVGDNDALHIQAKTAMPSIQKDIWEDKTQGTSSFPSGAAGTTSAWTLDTSSAHNMYDEGDYEIGQDIPFRLTSVIPDMSEFDTYKYIIRDDMSDGLSLPVADGSSSTPDTSNFKVSILDKSSQVKYVLSDTEYSLSFEDDANTADYTEDFIVTISDLKAVLASAIAAQNDSTLTASTTRNDSWQIVVEYTATLNASAVVGNDGNPNTVYLEYSNNPNKSGSGDTDNTGITPKDTVWAFTYGTDVNKVATVDGEQTALEGAEFVLYKVVDNVKYFAKVDANNKIEGWVAESECVTTEGNVTTYDSTKITVFTGSSFTFEGLDEHDAYFLREIKAPTNYNLLSEDIRLVFSATIAKNESGEQRITALLLDAYKGTTDSKFVSETITGDVSTGHATLNVENNMGATLPETGALGTTLMVLVGAGIAIMAAVLMITRKKMSAYQD